MQEKVAKCLQTTPDQGTAGSAGMFGSELLAAGGRNIELGVQSEMADTLALQLSNMQWSRLCPNK
jgi:hypothetical protein